MTEILSDECTHKNLLKDSTLAYKDQLNLLIDYGYRTLVLNKKEKKYLVPSVCGIPIIYTLPKAHKMHC